MGIDEVYPIGTTLDAVKIVKVETERGLLVNVQDNLQGFVHVGDLFAILSII
jgi:rRNA biogenesis protein RRP5